MRRLLQLFSNDAASASASANNNNNNNNNNTTTTTAPHALPADFVIEFTVMYETWLLWSNVILAEEGQDNVSESVRMRLLEYAWDATGLRLNEPAEVDETAFAMSLWAIESVVFKLNESSLVRTWWPDYYARMHGYLLRVLTQNLTPVPSRHGTDEFIHAPRVASLLADALVGFVFHAVSIIPSYMEAYNDMHLDTRVHPLPRVEGVDPISHALAVIRLISSIAGEMRADTPGDIDQDTIRRVSARARANAEASLRLDARNQGEGGRFGRSPRIAPALSVDRVKVLFSPRDDDEGHANDNTGTGVADSDLLHAFTDVAASLLARSTLPEIPMPTHPGPKFTTEGEGEGEKARTDRTVDIIDVDVDIVTDTDTDTDIGIDTDNNINNRNAEGTDDIMFAISFADALVKHARTAGKNGSKGADKGKENDLLGESWRPYYEVCRVWQYALAQRDTSSLCQSRFSERSKRKANDISA
jgi:hypothetical protein